MKNEQVKEARVDVIAFRKKFPLNREAGKYWKEGRKEK